MSASPAPASQPVTAPASRHAAEPIDRQRMQLEKLLKDPAKPAYIPPPPKEKTIRPAREMMKNVQGSSAGAGSGEFHVYKASRRREYERLKLMEEEAQQEAVMGEFERKRKEREEQAEAKTAKNRAKRQKKKVRGKGKGPEKDGGQGAGSSAGAPDVPLKKRRLVNGKELVFKRPGEDSDDDEDDEDVGPGPAESDGRNDTSALDPTPVRIIDTPRIIIHEEDNM
ncbi:hypothetical protein IEO21_01526 [Rhodonia placenta]|uniref:DUF1168-domain-containing protein n=1 Tax=Rhodonia placenta TaxID=104341 RepID=A0A8H7P9G7_9APHY|nr:hypothetical protein IEO21_01526 [Postia placenta]